MALTTDHWIEKMQCYPSGTLVRFIGGAIVFDNPDGTPAKPFKSVGGKEETQGIPETSGEVTVNEGS